MNILGGNQVVFYASPVGDLEVQLNDCLEQLEVYMDENQIYPGSLIRHNIFLNVNDQANYNKQKAKLEVIAKRRFPLPMIINFIAQSPAEGDIALESTYIQSNAWNCLNKESNFGSCQLIKKGAEEVVIGSVQVDEFIDMQQNAEKAFEQMENLLALCGLALSDLVKQWSYIERMLEEDIMLQRYQTFNDVRTKYYDDDFEGIGYPASTEVGTLTGGIIIEFLAVKNRTEKSKKINNPAQKETQEYSHKVLASEGTYIKSSPTTPKLDRARSLSIDNKTMIFISGTSSIIGERITAKGDAKEQAIVILENLKKITGIDNLNNSGIETKAKGNFSLIKAFIQNKAHFQDVYNILNPAFKDVPMLLIQADLPRKDILVELEAELIF